MSIKTVWITPIVGLLSVGRSPLGLGSWRIVVSFFLCLLLASFPVSGGRLSGAIQDTATARFEVTPDKALTEGCSLGALTNSGTAIRHGATLRVNPTGVAHQALDGGGVRADGYRQSAWKAKEKHRNRSGLSTDPLIIGCLGTAGWI